MTEENQTQPNDKEYLNLNYQQWTFGTTKNPDEILNLLPEFQLDPKEEEDSNSTEEVDESFLNEQKEDQGFLNYMANYLEKVDVSYLKFKPIDNIDGDRKQNYQSSLPPLAEGILRGSTMRYKQLLTINKLTIETNDLNPEKIIEDYLKPFENEEESEFDQSFGVKNNNDNMGNEDDSNENDILNTSGTFEQKVKTEEEVKQENMNELKKYMLEINEFESQMSGDKEYLPEEDLLYIDLDMTLISNSPLMKLQKLFGKVSKYDGFDLIDKDMLSNIFYLLHNCIKYAEFKTLFEINSNCNITFTEDNLEEEFQSVCTTIKYGLLATNLTLSIANKLEINRCLYSENIMTSSLSFIRNQLTFTLFPSIEVVKGGFNTAKFTNLSKSFMRTLQYNLSQLSNVAFQVANFFHDFKLFIKDSEIGLSIVITLSYICISSLFVDLTGGKKYTIFSKGSGSLFKKQFQGTLEIIFTNYPDQRSWILEEILASLIKLPLNKRTSKTHRLIDGRFLHSSTVLILQLIQNMFENSISKWVLESKDYQEFAVDQFSPKSNAFRQITDKLYSNWKYHIEEASKIIGFTLKYLFSRIIKNKNQNDSEYRIILDNILEDSLTILNLPEWPGAEILLRVMTTILVGFADDSTTEQQLKGFAIEYLGHIAARIKKHNIQSLESDYLEECTKSSKSHDSEIIATLAQLPESLSLSLPISSIETLLVCEDKIQLYLQALSTEDSLYEGARKLHLCQFGMTLLKIYHESTQNDSNSKEVAKQSLNKRSTEMINSYLAKVIALSCTKNTIDSIKVSEQLETQNRDIICILNEAIAFRKPLYQCFNSILSRILLCLEMNVLSYRSKSIKAITQIVSNHPEIINIPKLRSSILYRIQDTSASVRDSAVDLIGRYMNLKPETIPECYKIVSERVLDIATAVRKRVVRLLRDLYSTIKDRNLMIDICCKILNRTYDDEFHVRELAIKILQDIWFMPLKKYKLPLDYDLNTLNDSKIKFESISILGQKELIERVSIIIDVVKVTCVSLETDQVIVDFISKSLDKPKDNKNEAYKRWGSNMIMAKLTVSCLLNQLVNLPENINVNIISSILKCIYTFCSSKSSLIPINHIPTLEPYLGCFNEPSEQMNMYYVLKIYNQVIANASYNYPKLLSSIEGTLLNSLPKLSPIVLCEAIPCLCVVSEMIGSIELKISKLYQSCIELLKKEKVNFEKHGILSAEKNTIRLLLICSLVSQNIDKKRGSKNINRRFINNQKLLDEVYELILFFTNKDMKMMVRLAAIQSLGFVMLEYQSYFIKEESFELFSNILLSKNKDIKLKFLNLLYDYLAQESPTITDILNKTEDKKIIGLEDLIGNTEQMGESSIICSVMQYCLENILNCGLSGIHSLQMRALKVIKPIVEQGHVNPLMCLPVLIGLTTSEDKSLSNLAYFIYTSIAIRFESIAYSKNIEAVQVTYQYHLKVMENESLFGFRQSDNEFPVGLLNDFYKFIRHSKQRRNELFHSIIKNFEYDFKQNLNGVDVQYHKFILENLAFLEYKTLDEPIYLITLINQVISTTGADVIHYIDNEDKKEEDNISDLLLAKLSDSMSCLLILKINLQMLYTISSSKLMTYRTEDSKLFKDKPLTKYTGFDPTGDWTSFKFSFGTVEDEIALNIASERFKTFLSRDSSSLLDCEDVYSNDTSHLRKYQLRTRNKIKKASASKAAMKYQEDTTDEEEWEGDSDEESENSEEDNSDEDFMPRFPISALKK
ncbi:hypothetical protein K502DRAFT_324980 [Neoconidiobolus thromboides FSU 785]|nr:hypothetical protein K502DRAFT_324980 [Neoconidiobolus thromboides FSU 785]